MTGKLEGLVRYRRVLGGFLGLYGAPQRQARPAQPEAGAGVIHRA